MDAVPPSFDDVLDPDSLQLSQDGTQLAAMHGTQILIWDVADGGAPVTVSARQHIRLELCRWLPHLISHSSRTVTPMLL